MNVFRRFASLPGELREKVRGIGRGREIAEIAPEELEELEPVAAEVHNPHALSKEMREKSEREYGPVQKAILKDYWTLPLAAIPNEDELRSMYNGTQESVDRLIDYRRAARREWETLVRTVEVIADVEGRAWRVPSEQQSIADEFITKDDVHAPLDIPGYIPVDTVFFRLNPSLTLDLSRRFATVIEGLRATHWIDEQFGWQTPDGVAYPTPPQRTEDSTAYDEFLNKHPAVGDREFVEASPTFPGDDWDVPEPASVPDENDEQRAA